MSGRVNLALEAAPLRDDYLYTVRCGGVSFGPTTLVRARAWAHRELKAWSELGYRRRASIYYRDGSLVSTVRTYQQ